MKLKLILHTTFSRAQHNQHDHWLHLYQYQGNFSVAGQIKWHLEERIALVGKQKIERRVRDALLADSSGSILLSIWAELVDQV